MKDTSKNRELVEKAVYLYKIAFSNAARKCNANVRYVSQHSIIWGAMGQRGFEPRFWLGVCAGLALEWIKAQKQGRDLISDLATARNEVFSEKPATRRFLAGIVDGIHDSHKLQNQLKTALTGVCTPVGTVVKSPFPFSDACSSMKNRRFYYISSGSHAMAAACHGKSRIDFYDPNVGEVRGISTKALRDYLKEAVEASCLAQNISVETVIGKKFMTVVGFSS